jgi:sulfotransferase family protein
MKPSIERPIFLVGCARSGTTLLQALLATHPLIASFPETHFFPSTVGQRARRRFDLRPSRAAERVRFLLSDWRVRLGIPSRESNRRLALFLDEIGRGDLQTMFATTRGSMRRKTRSFVALLDRLTVAQGKTRWLEKTPDNLDYIDVIERLVPDALFIHMLRNGADNVASLYDAARNYPEGWWGRDYGSLDRCIARWLLCMARTRAHLGKDNHAVIRYEQLVADPRAALVSVCSFIEVPFEERMLTGYGEVSRRVILGREPWKARVSEEITDCNGTKFHELFDERQRRYVLERIAGVEFSDLDIAPSILQEMRRESVSQRP